MKYIYAVLLLSLSSCNCATKKPDDYGFKATLDPSQELETDQSIELQDALKVMASPPIGGKMEINEYSLFSLDSDVSVGLEKALQINSFKFASGDTIIRLDFDCNLKGKLGKTYSKFAYKEFKFWARPYCPNIKFPEEKK